MVVRACARLPKVANLYPSVIADVFASWGDGHHAFEWLDRAFAQRESGLGGIKTDFAFRKFHTDPRYLALLKKLNLPPD